MADVKWIKIVTDIFDDEKIKYIETTPNGDTTIVIWFRLLCLAGKSNRDGFLMITDRISYTDEMLASIFNRDIKVIRLALKMFEKLEMIEILEEKIYIPKWEKHQSIEKLENIREKTRLRVATYRKKKIENKPMNRDCVTEVTQDDALRKQRSNAIELELELDKEVENTKYPINEGIGKVILKPEDEARWLAITGQIKGKE